MLIETNAMLYAADTFHSNKTNKDYHRCGLLIEGTATTMFMDDRPWSDLVKQPFFNGVCASHKPAEVIAKLEIRFTEKGAQTYLREIKEPAKGK